MELKLLYQSARSAVIEIDDGGIYETKEPYQIYVNGCPVMETVTVVTSIFDLTPDTEYEILVKTKENVLCKSIVFCTEHEFVTLNVRDFGAKGDGICDDTKFIQAAIMCCPKEGRVLVPGGIYLITSLFLKSDLRLELAEGAELRADTTREHFPRVPSVIKNEDETDEYHLGSWEGEPMPMFAAIISGYGVENVLIYGKGTINGSATKENWWYEPKKMVIAFRPRLFFINHCKNVTLQGITCKNSPSWTLHPFFSDNLGFYNLSIENPSDSPNTDGIDPESCKNVEIAGVRFSLGDDCIAIKSGKIYMGKKYKTPSRQIHIYQCLMENGHGAVTLGSEIGAGVKQVLVEKCRFSHTDRGLRIKTRRGRGEDSVLDEICFKDIDMDHVMTPFTANAFYFCDADGKTDYVQSRDALLVDERTPSMKHFVFENIHAKNCHVAAAYFEGLPEQKIEKLEMRNIDISFAKDAKCDTPIMACGVNACSKRGLYAGNVKQLVLRNVQINGNDGETIELHNVDEVIEEK